MISKHFRSRKSLGKVAAAAAYYGLKGSASSKSTKKSTKTGRRYGRSRTKTKQKRKKTRNVVDTAGIAETGALIILNKKHPKNQAKGGWTYTQTVPEAPFCAAGTQLLQQFVMGTLSQMTTSTGVGYNGNQSQVALRLLNPNYLNTGSAYIPAAGVPTTDSFIVKSMKMDLEICSWCSSNMTIDLLFYVAKSPAQDDLQTVWQRGLQQQGSGKSLQTKLSSPLYQGVAGYGSIDEPYGKPTDASEYIKDYYTMKHHTTINLEAGSTQKYNYRIVANKTLRSAVLDQAALDGEYSIAGLTCFVMMIGRGQLVDDTTGGINRPTFSSTKLGVVCRQTYECAPVSSPIANRSTKIHSYNLPLFATGPNQTTIDVDDTVDTVKTLV